MNWRLLSLAVTSVGACVLGCSGEAPVGPEPTSGAGAGSSSNTGSGGAQSSSGAQQSSSGISSASVSSSGTGGSSFECDPPAAAGSLFELGGQGYVPFAPVSMCQFRGNVMLIYNSAGA